MSLVLEEGTNYGFLLETSKRSSQAAEVLIVLVRLPLWRGILHFVLTPGFRSPWDGWQEDRWEHGLAKWSVAWFVIILHLFCTIWTSKEHLPSSFSMTTQWSETINSLAQMEDGRAVFLFQTPEVARTQQGVGLSSKQSIFQGWHTLCLF